MGFSASQMAKASLITKVGGAVTSAVGAYYGAGSQKSALESQARIADLNAQVAETGAQRTLDASNRHIQAITLKAGQIKGAQRAAMAANGVDLGTGSAAEVAASTEIMKEIDKNQAEVNGITAAWSQRSQATNYQVDAISKRGSAAGINPLVSGATSLLGSAGTVAESWYRYQKVKKDSADNPDDIADAGGIWN